MDNVRNIYVVRHCQPSFSSSKKFCIGKLDIPLSHEGREQAKNLLSYFSDKKISSIYSSNLKRARETAEILANNAAVPIIKSEFSEIDMGKWDGLTFDEIKFLYPEEYKKRGEDFENYVVDGGESIKDCQSRAMSELYKTLNESSGNIIIVTHAGVIRAMLSSVEGISICEAFSYKIDYGSVKQFVVKHHELQRSVIWNF